MAKAGLNYNSHPCCSCLWWTNISSETDIMIIANRCYICVVFVGHAMSYTCN